MDIAHDEVCSECHPRYPTSQFQHLALEEECFSTVQTVWATANLASCPQCMLCGSQRRHYNLRHNAVLAELGCFFYQLAHQSLWLGQELQHHCRPSTEEYRPWHHLSPTNLKPGLVIWNDAQHAVCLIELTFPLSRFCWCSNGRTTGIMTLQAPSSAQSRRYRLGPVGCWTVTVSWTCSSFTLCPSLLL